MLDPVSPVFHKYVPPAADGVAVSVADSPGQIVVLFTVTDGIGFTVTVPLPAGLVHPFKV